MVMAEAESGQLTAEITDRGDKRCIALGALGANEWFGLRLHGNRLEFLAGSLHLTALMREQCLILH